MTMCSCLESTSSGVFSLSISDIVIMHITEPFVNISMPVFLTRMHKPGLGRKGESNKRVRAGSLPLPPPKGWEYGMWDMGGLELGHRDLFLFGPTLLFSLSLLLRQPFPPQEFHPKRPSQAKPTRTKAPAPHNNSSNCTDRTKGAVQVRLSGPIKRHQLISCLIFQPA